MAETTTSTPAARADLKWDDGIWRVWFTAERPSQSKNDVPVREDRVTTDDIEKVACWLFDLGVWTPESRETFPFHDAATELLGLVLGDSGAVA